MTRIWVVRHGESMLNAAERIQGWSDAPLTALGREQAAERGRDFAAAGIAFDAVFSGDGMRHRETAAELLSATGSTQQAQPDPRWRELCFGALEGARTRKLFRVLQAHASAPDPFTATLRTLAAADPLAEAPEAVARRALAALHDVASAGAEVLVVTSGITILALLRALDAELTHLNTGPANLSVSTIRRAGEGWTIDRIASTDPVAG